MAPETSHVAPWGLQLDTAASAGMCLEIEGVFVKFHHQGKVLLIVLLDKAVRRTDFGSAKVLYLWFVTTIEMLMVQEKNCLRKSCSALTSAD